jgi:hypothetical protein
MVPQGPAMGPIAVRSRSCSRPLVDAVRKSSVVLPNGNASNESFCLSKTHTVDIDAKLTRGGGRLEGWAATVVSTGVLEGPSNSVRCLSYSTARLRAFSEILAAWALTAVSGMLLSGGRNTASAAGSHSSCGDGRGVAAGRCCAGRRSERRRRRMLRLAGAMYRLDNAVVGMHPAGKGGSIERPALSRLMPTNSVMSAGIALRARVADEKM